MPERKFVFFDFDGVIADSFDAAYTLKHSMRPYLDEETYRQAFEGNINKWVRDFDGLTHGPECRHDLDWFAHYGPILTTKVQPFDGMISAVKEFAADYPLIIISSTTTPPIRQFLRKYDVAECFAEVMGNDVHHSKVEKIRMAFEKYNTSSDSSVFITDTLGDIHEAKEHELGVIGVSWGFNSRETLESGIPFRIVDTPDKLPDAVADYFARPLF